MNEKGKGLQGTIHLHKANVNYDDSVSLVLQTGEVHLSFDEDGYLDIFAYCNLHSLLQLLCRSFLHLLGLDYCNVSHDT